VILHTHVGGKGNACEGTDTMYQQTGRCKGGRRKTNRDKKGGGAGRGQRLASVCLEVGAVAVSQSVDLGRSNNPNTTPTKDYEIVRVVVYLRGVQRGYAEEGERGSTPTG